MTPIKCPGCGLINWSTDISCSGCNFAFQPKTSPAIEKPSHPLYSFADLADPNDDAEISPSHSRTPQMLARMPVAQYAVREPQSYSRKESSVYTLSQTQTNNYYAPPVALGTPSAVKTENRPALQQNTDNSRKQAKSKSVWLFAAVVGLLSFLVVMILAGLVFFFNRPLFV